MRFVAPCNMSDDELAELISNESVIKELLSGARAEAARRMGEGSDIDGLRLRTGRVTQAWSDGRKAMEMIRHYCESSNRDLLDFVTPINPKKVLEELIDEDKAAGIRAQVVTRTGKAFVVTRPSTSRHDFSDAPAVGASSSREG